MVNQQHCECSSCKQEERRRARPKHLLVEDSRFITGPRRTACGLTESWPALRITLDHTRGRERPINCVPCELEWYRRMDTEESRLYYFGPD